MSLSSAAMDTRDLLPTIAVPTLVLWGEDDRRSQLHIAAQLHDNIPDADAIALRRRGIPADLTDEVEAGACRARSSTGVAQRHCHAHAQGSQSGPHEAERLIIQLPHLGFTAA